MKNVVLAFTAAAAVLSMSTSALAASGSGITASAASNSGLGAPFASAAASCGSTYEQVAADFGSFPVSRNWDAALARITTSAGFPRIDVYTGGGDSPGLVTGGADTMWMVMPPMPAGEGNTISANCQADGAAISAELYEVPTAPAVFAGASTGGVSEVAARADRGGHYYANLTLQQGAASLSQQKFGSLTQTFASSGRYDLGIYKSGDPIVVDVRALDGPQAKWQIEITRDPATVSSVSITPTFARQGAPLKVAYSVAGDTHVTANVVDAAGAVVRSLGSNFPASFGPHTVTWDGMDDAGRPVKDGTYKVMIITDESTTGEASVELDSTPPTATRLTPVRLASARALIVQVSDTTSGTRTAQLRVDGRLVRQLAPGTSSLLYRPVGGWQPGSHQAVVTATDAAGNRSQTTTSFTVSAPASSYKASCMDKGFKVRPANCVLAPSRDAAFAEMSNLGRVRWSTWGGPRAVGHGYELGMHLPYEHIPATVILSRPAYVEELGISVYKHFQVTTKYGTLSGTIQAN